MKSPVYKIHGATLALNSAIREPIVPFKCDMRLPG
jgi:hypothetical protein